MYYARTRLGRTLTEMFYTHLECQICDVVEYVTIFAWLCLWYTGTLLSLKLDIWDHHRWHELSDGLWDMPIPVHTEDPCKSFVRRFLAFRTLCYPTIDTRFHRKDVKFVFFTVRNNSFGKVMFSQVSVCPQGRRGLHHPRCQADTPLPGRHSPLPGRHPSLPGRHPPC